MRNKGNVKPFQQGRLELNNDMIFYYDTPLKAIVRKIRLIVVPLRFRKVVIS